MRGADPQTVYPAASHVASWLVAPLIVVNAAAAAQTFTDAERLPLSVVPAVAVTVLVFLVGLAIYKPGWRLRSPR